MSKNVLVGEGKESECWGVEAGCGCRCVLRMGRARRWVVDCRDVGVMA